MTVQSLSTSTGMIKAAKQRRPEAWERVVQTYGPMVYSWARQCGLQDTDAADLVQDVFCSVYQSIDKFDPERLDGRFRSWLFGVTRNRLKDYFRKTSGQPQGSGGTTAHLKLLNLPAASEGSIEAGIPNLAKRALMLIESDFEETTWLAFWRVVLYGVAPAAVAHELGMSVAAVYKAKSRVLQRLRTELGEPL